MGIFVLTQSSCGDETVHPGSNQPDETVAITDSETVTITDSESSEMMLQAASVESAPGAANYQSAASVSAIAQAVETTEASGSTADMAEPIDAGDSADVQNAATDEETEQATIGQSHALCSGKIFHAQSVVIPSLSKPDYLMPYEDPAFGERVVRITDNDFGEVSKPLYSTMQAWNADESMLMIYNTGTHGAGHVLLDGHSYKFNQKLEISPADLEEVYWSHTDPNALYYVSSAASNYGQLLKYNVLNSTSTVIRDFSDTCGDGLPTGGTDIHMQSLDDDLFGFRCRDDDGHYNMLSYRLSTDEVIASPIGSGSAWSEWTAPTPAPSGDRFWYQGASLSADLNDVLLTMDLQNDSEHSNVGRTATGQDALYQTSFGPSPAGCNGDTWQGVGHLIEHNLETGECRPIISQEQGYPYTTSGTHVSAQAYRAPERIGMSSIGNNEQLEYFDNGIAAPALLSEIYLADTSGVGDNICRLAHHRSYGKRATRGGYAPYFGEPHATISPSGTRILFGSDWYDSGSVDTFVIELPGYVRP